MLFRGQQLMRALVTGASGFIGSNLVERLVERGDDVRCLVRSTSNTSRLRPLGARLVEGDIRDIESIGRALNDADIVYHLAGLTMAFDARDLARVNIGGFKNVATAFALHETPPVVVSVSSLSAAGPSAPDRPRVESDPAACIQLRPYQAGCRNRGRPFCGPGADHDRAAADRLRRRRFADARRVSLDLSLRRASGRGCVGCAIR